MLKTCGGETRKPEFPRTGLDRTELSPGSGHVYENIFGSGRAGIKILVQYGWGYFLPEYHTFFLRILKIKWN